MFKKLNEVYETPADELCLEDFEKIFDLDKFDDLVNIQTDLDPVVPADDGENGTDSSRGGGGVLIGGEINVPYDGPRKKVDGKIFFPDVCNPDGSLKAFGSAKDDVEKDDVNKLKKDLGKAKEPA